MINPLFAIVLFFSFNAVAQDDDVRSYLQQQVAQFINNKLTIELDSQAQISPSSIDKRLKLSRCEQNLELSLPANMTIRRNTTVYLKCNEQPGWDLYLPVRVSIQKPYVTVNAPVAKGERLSADHLVVSYLDQSQLRGDFLSQIAPLIGARSKRELQPGQALRLHQLCLVCKGDSVDVIAQNAHFQLKTQGIAQQDASLGQKVKFTNLRSGKMAEGRVSAVGVITVSF